MTNSKSPALVAAYDEYRRLTSEYDFTAASKHYVDVIEPAKAAWLREEIALATEKETR